MNKMLAKAPASVKIGKLLVIGLDLMSLRLPYLIITFSLPIDFARGVTYNNTDDPILRKIYEKESDPPKSN